MDLDITRDHTTLDSRGLTNLSSTCFVSPKATGIVSLILQFALLVVSVLVVLFFFYHIGGYDYMGGNENSTAVQPISTYLPLDSSAAIYEELPANDTEKFPETAINIIEDVVDRINRDSKTDPNHETETTSYSLFNTAHFPNTTIYLKLLGTQLDMLELIRISTFIYVVLCILWLISIAFLLLSIKFEVLDMVILNAVFLSIASTYALVHALFIAVLLYYQNDLSWRTTAIVVGCAVALVCTTILCCVALALTIAWYRYIMYMNNAEKCFCLRQVVRLIKNAKSGSHHVAQDYAMPNVTRHSELPYRRGSQENNFTAF